MKYSLKSLVVGLVAFIAAFLVIFIVPDFEYNGILGIVTTVVGFVGVSNFRVQFESAVAFFKTKTMWGAIITAVPMVVFALAGFFEYNLPSFLTEALKYFVQVGGGWTLLGSAHVLNKGKVLV